MNDAFVKEEYLYALLCHNVRYYLPTFSEKPNAPTLAFAPLTIMAPTMSYFTAFTVISLGEVNVLIV